MQIEAPKIRTALALWADDLGLELSQLDADMLIDRLRALSTVTPADVGGLVEKLRQCAHDPMWADHAEVPKRWLSEAAATLDAQAAELAAKEEARAEQWRLRREAEADRDTALASLVAERAALAEARKALNRLTAWLSDEYDDVPNIVSVSFVFDNGEEIAAMPLGDFRAALKAAMEAGG